MLQLILHLVGDYVTQSNWMATRKTTSSLAAGLHALVYSLPFLLIGSVTAWVTIASTHFFIDRFRLARYVVYAKNLLGPGPRPTWDECRGTGYPASVPVWMAVWLMTVADNTLHLTINYLALRFL